MPKEATKSSAAISKDAMAVGVIVVVSLLGRLPFVETFQFVTFDGTYYLNQARTLFTGVKMSGAFPIGYPAAVAAVNAFVPEIVAAGRLVSFLSSVGAAVVLYFLGKLYVRKEYALLCALILAINPLFIRLSLETMSESLYILWVLLGFLFFVKKRYVYFGLTMGAAAITRPEALAIAGILMLTQWSKRKRIAIIVAVFAAVYLSNVAVLSHLHGRLVVVPKTQNLGASASAWEMGEATFDFEEKTELTELVDSRRSEGNIFMNYVQRFPRELFELVRHALPVIILLALLGFRERRTWVFLAALVPMLVYPAATPRSEDRFVLPYLPILFLVGVVGLQSIGDRRLRSVGLILVIASAAALPFLNRDTLLVPEHSLFQIRSMGVELSDRVQKDDKIADRKPFFAFYAGGQYVEIPLAPYDRTVQYLVDNDVRFVFLNARTIEDFRPALVPLLYDKAAVAGEMRLRQVYVNPPAKSILLERAEKSDPLQWESVAGYAAYDFAPTWSPDGQRLAFRSADEKGKGFICVVSPGQSTVEKLMDESTSGDQLAWSPDGEHIAFSSSVPGTHDLFVLELTTLKVTQIVASDGDDRYPSWSPDGRFIAFASNRTGRNEIWIYATLAGKDRQLTNDGDNIHPAFSPSGRHIAWVKEGSGVVIMDLQTRIRVQPEVPNDVSFAPAWSPDGKYLAVTGDNWGSRDIYLIRADGSEAILLTKFHTNQGMPSWHPDGRSLAIYSDHGGQARNWILTGLQPYLNRLDRPGTIQTFSRDVGE